MRQTKSKLIRRLLAFSSTRPSQMTVLERWQYKQTKKIYRRLPGPARASFLDEIAPIKAALVEKVKAAFPSITPPSDIQPVNQPS